MSATLTIDGVPISSTWDGTSVVALANIVIPWGRDDLYEPVPPTSFDVYLIDPAGTWATDNDLSGKELVVGDDYLDKIILRGTIAEPSVTRIKTIHPVTSQPMVVWLVKLTGRCRLADLDQARLTGSGAYAANVTLYASNPPYNDGPWNVPERPAGWWPSTTDATRLASIMLRGGANYIDGIDVPSRLHVALGLADPGPSGTIIAMRQYNELSALGLISDVLNCYPLGHVNYNPTNNHVELGSTATTGGLALVLDGTTVVVEAVAGITIPAGEIIVPDDATITSTISYAIDTVAVAYSLRDLANVETGVGVATAATQRSIAGSTTDRNLVLETGLFNQYGAYANGNALYQRGTLFGQALATLTADLVDDVNGMFAMPPLTFDTRRFEYSDELLDVILDTKDHATPLHFPGSMFEPLANVPVQHQIIGGTLRWVAQAAGSTLPAGWVLEATTAPATGTVDPVSISELVTNPTVLFSDFDPSITLATLGLVTIGLD